MSYLSESVTLAEGLVQHEKRQAEELAKQERLKEIMLEMMEIVLRPVKPSLGIVKEGIAKESIKGESRIGPSDAPEYEKLVADLFRAAESAHHCLVTLQPASTRRQQLYWNEVIDQLSKALRALNPGVNLTRIDLSQQ